MNQFLNIKTNNSISNDINTAANTVANTAAKSLENTGDSLATTANSLTNSISDKINTVKETTSSFVDNVSNRLSSIDFNKLPTNEIAFDDSSQPIKSGFNWWSFLKYFFIIFVIFFLAVNLFIHLGKKYSYNNVASTSKKEKSKNKEKSNAKSNNENDIEFDSDDDDIELNKEKEVKKLEPKKKFTAKPQYTVNNKIVSEPGYCYIGEDRGYRSCIDVNIGDECMSGKIFPTKDICINPSLRQ